LPSLLRLGKITFIDLHCGGAGIRTPVRSENQ